MEKRRKTKKRFSALISFLLALALLTGTLGALPAECFAAQPEKAAFHSTYGFRLGSSAKMELQFRDKLEKNYKVNGNTYYGSQTDLSRQLRDQMVKRSDQVVLRLATDRRGLTGRSNSATQAREELFLGLLNDATPSGTPFLLGMGTICAGSWAALAVCCMRTAAKTGSITTG